MFVDVVLRSFFILFLTACAASNASAARLGEILAKPDRILLMRHADAPGIGDPPEHVIGDCTTQRNLGERGLKQAVEIGEWLRGQGVKRAQIFASPWCRCVDTATRLKLGTVTTDESLGSFFNDPQQSAEQTMRLQALVAKALARKDKKALILLTHQVNISAYVGKTIGTGDMVLVKVNRQGRVLSHKVYQSPY